MREIKIESWKANAPNFDEEGKIIGTKEVKENLLIALNNLVGSKKPEDLPRGIEKFRIFGKLSTAFEEADKTGILKLEEREYEFLKEIVVKDVPASWGLNPNIQKAINTFLEAEDNNHINA